MKCDFASVSVSFAPRLEFAQIARNALDRLAEENSVSATAAARLQIVLDELVSNVIIHGQSQQRDSDEPISVTMGVSDEAFTLLVVDTGPNFDPSAARLYDEGKRPRIGGRGLEMVQAIADQITHEYENGQNRTTVIKKVKTQSEGKGPMKPGMEISETRQEGAATVRLTGRIDSGNAAHLTEHLSNLVADGHEKLTLDMSELEYLTSAGFRTLLVVSDKAEEAQGDLVLTNMTQEVRELFDLSGLSQAFAIE